MDTWQSLDPQGYCEHIEKYLEQHGFEDSSWHNDISPSFERPIGDGSDLAYRLWIDQLDIAERDGADPRFELHLREGTELVHNLGMSERWGDIAEFIEALDQLSHKHPRTVLGEPVRRTDWDQTDLQDLTGYDPKYSNDWIINGSAVVAALIYHDSLFIHELADGRYWTIINRDEYLGQLAECEIPLAEFAESEGIGKP